MDPLSSKAKGAPDGAFSPLDETQFFESQDRNAESTFTPFSSALAGSEPRAGQKSRDAAAVLPDTSGGTEQAAAPPHHTRSPSGRGFTTSSSMTSTASAPPYLEVTCTDPVKQGDGVQAYVSYRLSTKTNLPQYRSSTFSVIRRFSDFLWLHDRLAEKNQGTFLPPLPEKNVVEKFRYSADFIELRRRALDTFINRIAVHPLLRFSTDLQLFLEANEEIWAMEMARATSEASVLKSKPREFLQMFKNVQSSVTDRVLGKEKPVLEVDEEYESLKSYVLALEGHLAEARKQAERLTRRHREMSTSLTQFGESVVLLGNCEGGSLGRAFAELGNRSDSLATKSDKQAMELSLNFEQPLRQYVRMVREIKSVMADRVAAQQQHQQLLAEEESKQTKLAKLRATPVPNVQKIGEAEKDLAEHMRRIQVAKERYDTIVERMRGEMVRFQSEKARDLSKVLHDFALMQAQLATETAHTWRTLLPEIEAAKSFRAPQAPAPQAAG